MSSAKSGRGDRYVLSSLEYVHVYLEYMHAPFQLACAGVIVSY